MFLTLEKKESKVLKITKKLLSLLLLIGITTFVTTKSMNTVPPKKQASHLLKIYFKLLFPSNSDKIITPEKANKYYSDAILTIENAKKSILQIAKQAIEKIEPIAFDKGKSQPFRERLIKFNDQLSALHYLIGIQFIAQLDLKQSLEVLSKLHALFDTLLQAQTTQEALEAIETFEKS